MLPKDELPDDSLGNLGMEEDEIPEELEDELDENELEEPSKEEVEQVEREESQK